MAGGSPATMPEIVLEYSEEENSRRDVSAEGTMYRAPMVAVSFGPAPSGGRMTSSSFGKAILRRREASSSMPRTLITGVGLIELERVAMYKLRLPLFVGLP